MAAAPASLDRRRWRVLLTAWLLGLVAATAWGQAAGPAWGETLLLALKVNGVAQEGMLRAVRTADGLAIPQTMWRELHLRLPTAGARVIDGEQHVLLASGGPLRWWIDDASQTLEVEAPASAFLGQQLTLTPGLPRVTQPSVWAPFVNYDAQWQRQRDGRSAADALWELGAFSPHGDFSSTGLARGRGERVRLETRWQRDDPERLAKLRVGDSVTQAGAWGRPVRYGGLQWGTDFSLQPGFLSFPLPTLRGEAALPSTLDVYVNNSQRLQSRLQPGAFDLTELPVVTGQGEVRTIVRDLLGREQVVVTPYYVSPALLKPGLSTFNVDVGAERERYGLASNRYGRLLASMTERRGITDRFTRELRAEVTGRQQAVGATGWLMWPSIGTANASAVVSRSRDRGAGWMWSAGLDRQAHDWSGSLQWRQASAGFRQVGQDGTMAPRTGLTVALGTSWSGQSLGVSVVRQRGGGADTQLAQVNYSVDLGAWGYVGAIAFKDLSRGGSGTSVALSWSRALDSRHSAGASLQRQPRAEARDALISQLQVQRNPAVGSGLGYQLTADSGGRQLAQAQWQGEHTVLSGGVARRGSQVESRAGASGGIAWVDGSTFVSRRIDGGIAVVDVGGHEGVRVTQDNQEVARTDARGRAFVTGLRGYQPNRLGIEAADLPMDAELQALEIKLVPAARSAARIVFPVQQGRAASLRVFDATGEPLPPGAVLKSGPESRAFPVGLAGRTYLAGLADGRNEVQANWQDDRGAERQCRFEFTLPRLRSDDLPDLGSLLCR
jgi:outer membrane usher protein